jgi:hypothetical protein
LRLEATGATCENGTMTKQQQKMTDGQRAYEVKRAAKAGVSLEKWLSMKESEKREEARAREQAAKAAQPVKKKPGLLSRLLEAAHKPL